MSNSNIIFEILQREFLNAYGITIKEWFPSGKDMIRVILNDGKILIFHYKSEKDWRIETVDSFLKTIKEDENSTHDK